jgi:hypothetical protein
MNSAQKFTLQVATVGGLLGGLVLALAITKTSTQARNYAMVLGTIGAVAGYNLAKKSTATT